MKSRELWEGEGKREPKPDQIPGVVGGRKKREPIPVTLPS